MYFDGLYCMKWLYLVLPKGISIIEKKLVSANSGSSEFVEHLVLV